MHPLLRLGGEAGATPTRAVEGSQVTAVLHHDDDSGPPGPRFSGAPALAGLPVLSGLLVSASGGGWGPCQAQQSQDSLVRVPS